MYSRYRYVSSLFLAAALLAPPGIMAAFVPQEQERHEEHEREEHRYYDSEHRDYHHGTRAKTGLTGIIWKSGTEDMSISITPIIANNRLIGTGATNTQITINFS